MQRNGFGSARRGGLLGQIARCDVEVPHEVARGKLFEGRLALSRKLTFGAVWYNVDMYHVGALGRVVDDWRPHGDGGRPE